MGAGAACLVGWTGGARSAPQRDPPGLDAAGGATPGRVPLCTGRLPPRALRHRRRIGRSAGLGDRAIPEVGMSSLCRRCGVGYRAPGISCDWCAAPMRRHIPLWTLARRTVARSLLAAALRRRGALTTGLLVGIILHLA